MNAAIATKKEYQKRLASKLTAYKEITALIKQVGSSEDKILQLLGKQEAETTRIENEMKNNRKSEI